ncbi:putative amidase [Seiridium unicorne]|uniref:amidase n=1 Tax=Seiridium unicorne TaxID=138068 RepID=A0ABR2V8X3_9PEZI
MNDWTKLIEAKRATQIAQIPPEWRLPTGLLKDINETSDESAFNILTQKDLLTDDEVRLTEKYSARDLCAELAAGRLSAAEVCTAFCHRAAVAHQLTNCATEIFFGEAIERAKQLDDYLVANGKPLGPFHGLPISLKDTFNVIGQSTTVGYVSFLPRAVATSNSPLVNILLDLGAILYIKTNVPQTMLTVDTENNIFGRTLNPYCFSLTAGGSSGGEGALVGLHGSPMGIGTDIGGSIRLPSLCNGLYGFKATANRVAYGGQQSPARIGSPGIVASAGPLCHSSADLTFFTQHILTALPWTRDPTALSIPWRHLERPSSLKMGVWLGDPQVPLDTSVQLALEATAEKLRLAGHQLINIDNFPHITTAAQIATGFFRLDNKQVEKQYLEASGEKPIRSLAYIFPANAAENRPSDLDDVWDLNVQLASFREDVFNAWRSVGMEVLLCPVAQHGAVSHDTFGPPLYTLIWNLLDFPAAVLPIRDDYERHGTSNTDSS